MRGLSILIACLLTVQVSYAQKRKKTEETLPAYTKAQERWEGYQQRLALEDRSMLANVNFRSVGPTVMSGRVVDLAVNPENPSHFYVAYASGSLWETKNNGTSFTPLFDNQIVMTIGDIAVDWKSGDIFVGTGENNSSRSSYSGYGLFKSSDNGKTWQHLGLEETHHIGRILLHPSQPEIMWVAALGHLYSKNPERGLYKSTDGGKSWRKTLYINEETGIVDLAMHPQNPDILVAASWEKDRKAWNFKEAGDGTAIFRSENAGETWVEIADDSGFPDTKGTGRIGLAFAPSKPSTIYAVLDNQDRRAKDKEEDRSVVNKSLLKSISASEFLKIENKEINTFLDENRFPVQYNAVDIKTDIENGKLTPQDLYTYVDNANDNLFDTPVKGAEMYRSEDAGRTWTKQHEGYIESMVFSYGYYFGQVRVDPKDPNVVYTMGVPIVKSYDGGKTFKSINEENVHADHHALWINPENSNHLILGNDGGVYISYDSGETWINCNSPSVGQFYSIAVDMESPYNVYGGLQDNGVWKGPSNYTYSREWYQEGKYPYERIMGGDGMQVAIDTRNNTTVYTGYQYGNYFRLDTETGERSYITPKHSLGDRPYRWNWEAPIHLSKHNQDIVYFGSNKFHRSMNGGESFETLSEDLTTGGKKGDVSYGTLTTISESPLRFGLLYVGSDDGLIHISRNTGQSWTNITGSLPRNFWVSQVYASHHKEGRVYAALNGYRWDHFEAMVYVSEDYGSTWSSISSDLPKEPVNVIKEDPENPNILYVGTDHGVYASLDRGASYHAFVAGLPNTPVHDLVVHPRDHELVLGTHGRGIYIADVSHLQLLSSDVTAKPLHLFEVEEVSFSSRWGSKRWSWGELIEPSVEFAYYSANTVKGKLELLYKNQVVIAKELDAKKGLNYEEVTLATTSDFKNLLEEEKKQDYKVGENGTYYLAPGQYEVKMTIDNQSETIELTIAEPKQRERRKE